MNRRQALRITAVAGLSTAFGGGIIASAVRRAGLHRVAETRTRMGTVVTITAVHPDADAARTMVSSSFEEMARLESLLSRHRPDTPVARLNATGVLEAAPAELIDVLNRASEYSERTDGAFDVTVAPLLDLYGRWFGSAGRDAPPEADLTAALRLVDHRALRVDGRAVALERPGMSVTLDGIAKGYIVDRTVGSKMAAWATRPSRVATTRPALLCGTIGCIECFHFADRPACILQSLLCRSNHRLDIAGSKASGRGISHRFRLHLLRFIGLIQLQDNYQFLGSFQLWLYVTWR